MTPKPAPTTTGQRVTRREVVLAAIPAHGWYRRGTLRPIPAR